MLLEGGEFPGKFNISMECIHATVHQRLVMVCVYQERIFIYKYIYIGLKERKEKCVLHYNC